MLQGKIVYFEPELTQEGGEGDTILETPEQSFGKLYFANIW